MTKVHLKSWKAFIFAGALLAAVAPTNLHSAAYTIAVDGSVKQGSVPHYWSTCVGRGGMRYCLKPAWQTAIRLSLESISDCNTKDLNELDEVRKIRNFCHFRLLISLSANQGDRIIHIDCRSRN